MLAVIRIRRMVEGCALVTALACAGCSVTPEPTVTSGKHSSSGNSDDNGSPSFGNAPSGSDPASPDAPAENTTVAATTVYAHSPTTLFKLDPSNDAITVVGAFSGGCDEVIDLAIDASSNAYVTTMDGLFQVNLASAACTPIASGTYPNSLSFVPKGTLDANAEALVGYFDAEYVRIDPRSGALTTVGQLRSGYVSSGDIVSVTGGGSFLTVRGNGCGDCLLQVDPRTGDMIQNYGDLRHANVFGLSFWAGTAYGFDDTGHVFSIAPQGSAIVTTDIALPNAPPGLSFWGAGSTTSAPTKNASGGGIPVR